MARPPKSPKRSWAALIKAEGPEGGRGLLGQTAAGMPAPVLRDGKQMALKVPRTM